MKHSEGENEIQVNILHVLDIIFFPPCAQLLLVRQPRLAAGGVTLRFVFDRGCVVSVNLQLSVPSVSALTCGSGVSMDPPPDDGKMPKDRGRSLLEAGAGGR